MVSEKIDIAQDTILVGLGASPGIAIGETYLVNRARLIPMARSLEPSEVAGELEAFLRAVELSRKQLEEVKAGVRDRLLADHLHILDTHLLLLEDQMLIDEVRSTIEGELLNAEGALKRVMGKYRAVFDSIEDPYLRDRGSDIDAIGERLLRNLLGKTEQPLNEVDRKVIVVSHDLSPADTMQMDKEKIIGFVTDVGGRTSHTAILARSLGIPAVVGLENVTSLVRGPVPAIIDGGSGTVILNPSADTFKEYLKKKQLFEYQEKELLAYRELAAETLDGRCVVLRCNVELPEEVPMAIAQGAEGIGLYRSEFLFMNRLTPPTEDEQVAAYRSTIEGMAPHPVTIRTLDVGGDKFIPEINLSDEANPAMGLRAVRFSLKERRLFKSQLRAILRASAFGKVRLMFPMISGVAEIRACKTCLDEAREELRAEGVAFDPKMPIGIMIETPSAALIADLLAREVDFFSIGTNDLIQYCLAVDRGNEHVAYLYEPLHPAILRALQMICQAARKHDIEVGMCGELASEPLYTLALLGLGFTELSMNAPGIPRVKRILRQVRGAEGEALVEDLVGLATATEVSRHIEKVMGERFPDLFPPPGL